MFMKFIYRSIRSIDKHVNLCTYTRQILCYLCKYVLPLQQHRDITSVLFCCLINVDILLLFFFTIFICYQRNVRQLTHCWCDIHAPARCSLTQACYRDITSVLFCRMINVDILLLFLTKFIRYKVEYDTMLMRYTHAPFQFYLSMISFMDI